MSTLPTELTLRQTLVIEIQFAPLSSVNFAKNVL
jgi:hypothetical protein